MKNMLSIKEINEMQKKGFDNYDKDVLLEAYAKLNSTKTTLSKTESEVKDSLSKKLSVGEQLQLDFGGTEFTSSCVELDDISFDVDDESLYDICMKAGLTSFCIHGVDTKAIKKEFKKGTLLIDLAEHIKITKQTEFKFSKKKVNKALSEGEED